MDGLEQPVIAIVVDTFLAWALRIGNRRNIPVASLWTQSPTMFSLLHHFELFKENGHFPLDVSGACTLTTFIIGVFSKVTLECLIIQNFPLLNI